MNVIQVPHSSLSAFYTLVEEARKSSTTPLSEDLQSYLVLLLLRFMKMTQLVDSIFALDFLENIKKSNRESLQILREIGDKCLLFSGLFPNRAKHRLVNVSYYVKLGQNAYLALSHHSHTQLATFYENLSRQFVPLMDILHLIREMDSHTKEKSLDLLTAEDLWSQTNSLHALKILKNSTKGFLLSGNQNTKH